MATPGRSFTIPKKKRIVEAPPEEETHVVSPIECVARITECAAGSTEYKSLVRAFTDTVSNKAVRPCIKFKDLKQISNPYLEKKFADFKLKLTREGQSDQESLGFLLIGFDPEDVLHIATHGYSIGTTIYGDLGDTTQGVYLYKHVDLTTAAQIYRQGVQRIMAFKTLRGRSSEVGLDSPNLYASLNHSSHVTAAVVLNRNEVQSRVSLFRNNAVYHYELTEMSNPVMHPSGVLPIAVFDLFVPPTVPKAVSRDLCPELELNCVFEGKLPDGPIFGGSSFRLEALSSCASRSVPVNLIGNVQLDHILSWSSVFSDESNLFNLLFKSESAGRLSLQPEVILADIRGADVTTSLFASYFVFTCTSGDFAGGVEDLRLEQKFALGLAGRDVSVYLFPSSDVSGRLGLPWLEWPHLHCVVIGTGQSLVYPTKENVATNLLEARYLTNRNDVTQAIDPYDSDLVPEWERLHQNILSREPDLAQRKAAFEANRRPSQPNGRPPAPVPPPPVFPSGRPRFGTDRDERAVVDMECDSPGGGSPSGMNISPPPPPIVLRSPSKLKSCLKVRSQPQPRRIGPPMANIGTGQPSKSIRWADTEGKSLSNYSSFNKDEASHEIKRRDMQKKEREEEKKANLKKRLSAKEEEEQIEQTKVTNNLFKDAFSSLSSASLSSGVSTDISPPLFVPPPLEPPAMVEDSIVGNGNGNRKMPILKKSVISMLPLPKFADSIADKAGNNTPPTTSNGEEQGNSNSGALWCSDDMEIDSDEDSQPAPPTEENSEEKTMEQEDSVFHDPADIDYDMHFKECDVPVKEDSNSQPDTPENSMDGDSGRASAASASLEEGGTPDAVQPQPEQNGTEPVNDDEDDTCEDSRLTDLVARIINKRKTAPSTSTSQAAQSPSEPSNEMVAEAPASPPRVVPPDLHRIMNQIRSIPLRSSNSISEENNPTPSAEVPQDEDIRIQLATVTPPRRSRFDVRPPDAGTIPNLGVPSSSTQPTDEIPPAASPEPTTEDVDMRMQTQTIPTMGKLAFSIKSAPKKAAPILPALSVFNALNDDDEEEPTTSDATPKMKATTAPSKDVDLREKRDDDRHRRSSDSSRRRRSRSRERDRDSRRDRDRRDRDRDRRRGRDERDSRREESRDRERREDRDRREESRDRERRRRDYDGREERREKDKDERKLGKEKVLPADFFTVPPPLVQQAVSGIEKTTEESAAQTTAAKNHDRVEDKLQSLLIQRRRQMHEREEAAKAAAENQPAPAPTAPAPFPVVQPAANHQPADNQPPSGPTTPNSILAALGISSPAVTQVFGGPPYENNGVHAGQNGPAYQQPAVDRSSFGGPPYEEVLQKPTPFFSSVTVKREPLASSPPPPASPDAPASPDGQSDTTVPLPIPIIDTSSPGLWTPSSDIPIGPGGAYNTRAYHQTAQPIPTSPSKKAKKPKDLDNLKEPANQTGKVIHSWDQVIQKKNEKGRNSQDKVDEEEEGEIKSDGEEDLSCLKPTPFATGPDMSPPAHLNHGFASHDPDMRPAAMHGQPVREFAEPFHPQHPSSSGWNPHEERKVVWRHEMPPTEPNGPYGPMHPPPRFAPPAPANPVVVPVCRKKQFLVVPDSMSMNPIVLSPDVIESFCDKMKRTATMDPELQCTFMPHARLMTYIFEQSMNNSLPPGTKNKYLHYLGTLRRYEELGVVKVMSEHHCDSTPNRSQDNTLNCLIFIQGQYRRDNPAAEVIYMSNVSPTCEFGQRLTACGIRIMKASTLIEKFPFFD